VTVSATTARALPCRTLAGACVERHRQPEDLSPVSRAGQFPLAPWRLERAAKPVIAKPRLAHLAAKPSLCTSRLSCRFSSRWTGLQGPRECAANPLPPAPRRWAAPLPERVAQHGWMPAQTRAPRMTMAQSALDVDVDVALRRGSGSPCAAWRSRSREEPSRSRAEAAAAAPLRAGREGSEGSEGADGGALTPP